jgi:hypothetical protein
MNTRVATLASHRRGVRMRNNNVRERANRAAMEADTQWKK